jgi:glycosyltransferase involved in cell wall biosynthesis
MINIAFIKFGGLSAGGTERWLQMMAANLPKEKYNVDYYYCDTAPYLGSDYRHADTDKDRLKYMTDNKVNLIKFQVGLKDITTPKHKWVDTNFWDVFDSSKYDFVQTAKAGDKEYPYYLIDLPIVEYITLSGGMDFSPNVIHSIHLSEWQRSRWIKNGGKMEKSSIIPIPVERPVYNKNLRKELNIPLDAIVAGYHQRVDNNIASEIPLKAFSKIQNPNWHFIIMGGGIKYRELAKEFDLKNIHFLDSSGDPIRISSFLNTLDIFAHGRKDGETFGTVLAEAMIHGLPCLSHYSGIADAQPETMGPGGFFAKDLSEYTQKLEEFFKNKELREKTGNLGKDYAEKFYTIEGTVRSLCSVYDKVLNDVELIDKKVFDKIKKERDEELKNTLKKRVTIFIKKIVYNKYLFICYRFIKK